MNINWKISILYCLMIVSVLVSCGAPATPTMKQAHPDETTQTDECLPPIYANGFSYPVEADNENLSYPGLDMFIPPPHPWETESPIPEIDGMDDWQQRFISVIQTRRVNEYFEVWIYLSRGLEEGYLLMYRTDTKEWKVLPEQINTLVVDKNGSLWGSYFEGSVLSRFDEQTGAFMPEKGVKNLPSVIKDDNNYSYSQVLLEEDGMFLILVPKDGIYKYDPVSGEVKRLFDIHGTFTDAKIASSGTIYVLFNEVKYQDGNPQVSSFLKFYDPETGTDGEYALTYYLEPYPLPFTLLIDYKGRVWMDNIAYVDENGDLYQLQRSPLFLSPIRESYNDYRYKRADIILESSDGRLWFLHPNNGMIYLDPEKGEWCWFTTYQSNIVEDSEHNLWMIADGKLYKLALKP